MPRLPIDYSKTIMYKLVCNDLKITELYVGHTTDMTERKYHHKYDCNTEKGKKYHQKKYVYMRENGGWDNWSMVMIEKYPCENKREAERREREIYEVLGAKLNSIRPFMSVEERYESNKKYHKEHNEEIKEYYQEYYQEHYEELLEYQKKYRESHKETNKEYQKEYYEKNKEKEKEKGCCEYCNKIMNHINIKRHHKTCPKITN